MGLLRVGHRGAAGTAPENTLASMRRALEIGVDGVEFDIHRSRDGHLVVIHDPTLDRTTTGSGMVGELSLAEIRAVDAGIRKGEAFAGERVPTLAELVEAVPGPVKLYLELKVGSFLYPGIEEELSRFILERGILDRMQVSSFDHLALLRLRQMLPTLETGMLYLCNPVDSVAMARACGASALHINWMYLTPDQVTAAHQAGLTVNAWTPNQKPAIDHCRSMGVDGIITDYPELLPLPVA